MQTKHDNERAGQRRGKKWVEIKRPFLGTERVKQPGLKATKEKDFGTIEDN